MIKPVTPPQTPTGRNLWSTYTCRRVQRIPIRSAHLIVFSLFIIFFLSSFILAVVADGATVFIRRDGDITVVFRAVSEGTGLGGGSSRGGGSCLLRLVVVVVRGVLDRFLHGVKPPIYIMGLPINIIPYFARKVNIIKKRAKKKKPTEVGFQNIISLRIVVIFLLSLILVSFFLSFLGLLLRIQQL